MAGQSSFEFTSVVCVCVSVCVSVSVCVCVGGGGCDVKHNRGGLELILFLEGCTV